MPQIFQVLKCYKCSVFQIHLTKKIFKFECKLCGEKQSIKRHYGIGTGKECRMHVQKLNVIRGSMEEKCTTVSNSDEEYEGREINEMLAGDISNSADTSAENTKWSVFLDKKEKPTSPNVPMFLEDREVFSEIPKKRKNNKFKIKAMDGISDDNIWNKKITSRVHLNTQAKLNNRNQTDNFEKEEERREKIKSLLIDPLDINNVRSDCIKGETCNNINKSIMPIESQKPVVIPALNNCSRWAQFIDTSEDIKHVNSNLTSNDNYISNVGNLFSVCEDNDLDKVLDI